MNTTKSLLIFNELNVFVDILCNYGAETAKGTVTFSTLQHILNNEEKFRFGIPKLTLSISDDILSKIEFDSLVINIQYDYYTDSFVFDSLDSMFKGIIEMLNVVMHIEPHNIKIPQLLRAYETSFSIMETYCFVDDTCDMFTNATL